VASNQRQLAVLGAILVVLAAVLYWQSTRDVDAPPVAPPAEAAGSASAASATRPAGVAGPSGAPRAIPRIALAALGQEQPEPADTGRDPFRFGAAPDARRPGGTSSAGPGQVPLPAAPVLPAGPIEPPGPPPIVLKFIGIAKQGTAGRLYAVLRDDRGIYYGAEGDMVEGRYRILRVTPNEVEIAYADGRGRTKIPLAGGQP
jgi:hypothetical protein